MPFLSRREFLAMAQSGIAYASLGLPRVANICSTPLPIRSRHPVSSFFPEVVDPETLRSLALTGVDMARQAGADYADVRIADGRAFELYWTDPTSLWPESLMNFEYAYGIRVKVNGAWGFTFGVDPTTDGIARAARAAVGAARGVAKFTAHISEMMPTPIARGEWATPVQIDPFAISPDTHVKMLGAYIDASQRVRNGDYAVLSFRWFAETRVFASTEGALITQRLARAIPRVEVQAKFPLRETGVVLPVPGVGPSSGGFEIAMGPALQERVKATTEEAVRLANYPETEADVGRYETVIDGTVVGRVLGKTLGPALEIGRILGYETDGAGTSFLSPADEVLGQTLFSPHLTVTSDRALPHCGAAKWDDEGVATEPFSVIEQGRVVDYFTTRVSSPELSTSYAKIGSPLRLHGCATAWTPMTSPTGCASQLTVGTGPAGMTLDKLVAQISNGILACGTYSVNSDQQLASGSFSARMLYEVKRGRITRRLKGGAIQFSTKPFWKAIVAMGDTSTVQDCVHTDVRGTPWTSTVLPIVAPAALLNQVDLIRMGRGF